MTPTTPLKLSAIAFGLLWSGWVPYLSHQPRMLVMTVTSALVVGLLWYYVMRWCFRLMRLLPDTGAGPSAAR